jgi:aspartate aminotransferase
MYGLLTYSVGLMDPVTVNVEMKPYTIYVDSLSKTLAATGVQLGWSLGPESVLGEMKKILGDIESWVPLAEQKAVACFLSQKESVKTHLITLKNELSERLVLIYKGIREMNKEGLPIDAIEPKAGIFLSLKMEIMGKQVDGIPIINTTVLTRVLLEKTGLAVLPFYAFGASEELPWFRLSVGACRKEDIGEMLRSLRNLLERVM